MRRRTYLTAATATLGGLAGCSGLGDDPETTDGTAEPTDDSSDGSTTPSGTPTATPMPAEAYAARLTVKAEEASLDGEFAVETGDDGAVYLRYEAVRGTRGDQRGRARAAYDALVEEADSVGRDLDARVKNGDTGDQWYRWNAKETWARSYLAGDLSKGEYLQKIDKTVRDW